MTRIEKFKALRDLLSNMANLSAELPCKEFNARYELLADLAKAFEEDREVCLLFPHEPSCSSPTEEDLCSSVQIAPMLCQVISTPSEEEKGEDPRVTCPPINECPVLKRPSCDATPQEKDHVPVESNPKLAAVLTSMTLPRKSLIKPKGRPKMSKRAPLLGKRKRNCPVVTNLSEPKAIRLSETSVADNVCPGPKERLISRYY